MLDSEFPPNNNAAKESKKKPAPEGKKVERLIEGKVLRRKKPLGKRFTEIFVGGDAKSVWGYVLLDVLIPAARDMLVDAGTSAIRGVFYGEGSSRGRGNAYRSATQGSHFRYDKQYSSGPIGNDRRPDPRNAPGPSRKNRANHNFEDIILATRVEAEEVIDRLFDVVSRYDAVTVSDLYEIVGVSGNYTDEKWGWTVLTGARVTRVHNGYLLDLPRPEPLD